MYHTEPMLSPKTNATSPHASYQMFSHYCHYSSYVHISYQMFIHCWAQVHLYLIIISIVPVLITITITMKSSSIQGVLNTTMCAAYTTIALFIAVACQTTSRHAFQGLCGSSSPGQALLGMLVPCVIRRVCILCVWPALQCPWNLSTHPNFENIQHSGSLLGFHRLLLLPQGRDAQFRCLLSSTLSLGALHLPASCNSCTLRFVVCRPWYLLCAHSSIVDGLSI